MFETLLEQRNRAYDLKLVERKKLALAKDLVQGKINGSQYLTETAKLYPTPPLADIAEDVNQDTRAIEFQSEIERRFP